MFGRIRAECESAGLQYSIAFSPARYNQGKSLGGQQGGHMNTHMISRA